MQAAEIIVEFHTANGVVESDAVLPVYSNQMGSLKVRVLDDTPDIQSVGYRCVEEGWGFHWAPFSITLYWQRPDGTRIILKVEN